MSKVSFENARKNKIDEFYTLYNVIENELRHYIDCFKNKRVYCNCDDYRYSNFVKYFKDEFKSLKLKALYATSYNDNGKGLYYYYDGHTETIKDLMGNGSFNSQECLNILENDSDIIVTNPPFSKAIQYYDLFKYEKKFLIILPFIALGSKYLFPYIFKRKLWIGRDWSCKDYQLPDDAQSYNYIKDNKKYAKLSNTVWFTNLGDYYYKAKFPNKGYEYYNDPTRYKCFDNTSIINVNRVSEIPLDYEYPMAVPLSFMQYLDPNKWILLGVMSSHKSSMIIKGTVDGKSIFRRLIVMRVPQKEDE